VPTPKSAEEEEAIAKENEKKLKIEVEKEWPIGWRDIKQHVRSVSFSVSAPVQCSLYDCTA
jgi:hypothetical protein